MILTKEIFEQGKSSNNGWNSKQLSIFSETQTHGWMKRLIGKEVSKENIQLFLDLKDAHLGKKFGIMKKDKLRRLCPLFLPVIKNLTRKDQYLHPNWQKLRLFILNRDNFTCVNCAETDKTLHVHHLKYSKDGFIWSVPMWYLVTLCDKCHSEEHNRDLTIY